ncbi:MAG: nitrilase-related carbon-nitrogen hydrolase [Sedimentisphaerales bacterium]|nr:nitrilase-related carbon-nitrogen hydrolase [Sedimentisphaerales bacterium]
MVKAYKYLLVFTMVAIAVIATDVHAKKIKVAVVQTVIENTLDRNLAKLLRFIGQAKTRGCQIVIFPECALYWPEISVDNPTKNDFDVAITKIAEKARSEKIYVIFGTGYKLKKTGSLNNKGLVYDPNGSRLVFYDKNYEVPQRFDIFGVPSNIAICSDRGYLEHSDLPSLVQGSKIIIDTSGGHGGDDGRPDLQLIRYRPWALRNDAFVIVCNPVHDDTDFMGHSPWGGGSAIIRPDGSIQAHRIYEKDVMIIEEIDTELATGTEARRRRNHPIFKPFWDMGKKLLERENVDPIPDIQSYSSTPRNIKIAAAQIACSRNIDVNVSRIKSYIRQAAGNAADIVIFPELAVTGYVKEDISAASPAELNSALNEIRNEAKNANIYVIVGMPFFADGRRQNCAFVIGDDGNIKTQYSQLSTTRTDLFRPGLSTSTMWFNLKGVYSIVTIGGDAQWVELGDLAANRGMYLHFHISCEADSSPDAAVLRKQKNLLMLMYAKYGAVVNAARPSGLSNPSSLAGGASMIVSREGGHNKPCPPGIKYYLPYQTSIAEIAGASETIIYATRKTAAKNDMDLIRYWRNRNRKRRTQPGWYEWIKLGTHLINSDPDDTKAKPN